MLRTHKLWHRAAVGLVWLGLFSALLLLLHQLPGTLLGAGPANASGRCGGLAFDSSRPGTLLSGYNLPSCAYLWQCTNPYPFLQQSNSERNL